MGATSVYRRLNFRALPDTVPESRELTCVKSATQGDKRTISANAESPPVHAGGPLHDPIFLGRLAPWWCVRRTLFSEVSNRGRK